MKKRTTSLLAEVVNLVRKKLVENFKDTPKEIDLIFQKIKDRGFDSLDADDKRTLRHYSQTGQVVGPQFEPVGTYQGFIDKLAKYRKEIYKEIVIILQKQTYKPDKGQEELIEMDEIIKEVLDEVESTVVNNRSYPYYNLRVIAFEQAIDHIENTLVEWYKGEASTVECAAMITTLLTPKLKDLLQNQQK